MQECPDYLVLYMNNVVINWCFICKVGERRAELFIENLELVVGCAHRKDILIDPELRSEPTNL